MTMLCAHDESGKILGWYTKDRASEISSTYVVVSDEQWEAAIRSYATHVDPDAGTFDRKVAPVPLESVKRLLMQEVDARAETERLRYITGGAGQAMTYAQKAEEARLCLSATGPVPEDYPLLSAEVGITAPTIVGVAQVVAAANAQWLQIGAAIEAARLAMKKAISEAETIDDAQAAASAVIWPNT